MVRGCYALITCRCSRATRASLCTAASDSALTGHLPHACVVCYVLLRARTLVGATAFAEHKLKCRLAVTSAASRGKSTTREAVEVLAPLIHSLSASSVRISNPMLRRYTSVLTTRTRMQ